MTSQVSPQPAQLPWVPSAPAILPPRSVVKDLWATPKRGAVAVSEAHERCSRVALTVTWMAATLGIALFVPDIGKVIELIGGISAFFIFIFPGKIGTGGEESSGGSLVPKALLQWKVAWLHFGGAGLCLWGTMQWGWVRGAVLMGLSFCTDSRAVPRVHDWDPQPRATQKVSVCVFSSGGGRGRGRGRVWCPMGHGPGRSLGVTLVKVGTLQGGGFEYGGRAVPGNVPGYQGCVHASRRCPGT